MSYWNSFKMRVSSPACLVLLSLCLAPIGFSQKPTPPDNSGTNKVQNRNVTADQGKDNKSDVQIAAQIRRSVVADKSLSTYAHNVKIIVVSGSVTLKGPVRTEQEKQDIAAKAAAVVAQDKVTNQITIKK